MKEEGRQKSWQEWLSTGPDWPESWWNLCPWRFSRPSRARFCQPDFTQEVGLLGAVGWTGWALEVASSLRLSVIFFWISTNQKVTFYRSKLSTSGDSLAASFIPLAFNVLPQLCQIGKINIPLHTKSALFMCHNYFHFPPCKFRQTSRWWDVIAPLTMSDCAFEHLCGKDEILTSCLWNTAYAGGLV